MHSISKHFFVNPSLFSRTPQTHMILYIDVRTYAKIILPHKRNPVFNTRKIRAPLLKKILYLKRQCAGEFCPHFEPPLKDAAARVGDADMLQNKPGDLLHRPLGDVDHTATHAFHHRFGVPQLLLNAPWLGVIGVIAQTKRA